MTLDTLNVFGANTANEPLRLQLAKQESVPPLGAPASLAAGNAAVPPGVPSAPDAQAAAPKKAPKAKAKPSGEASARKSKSLILITK